MGLALRPAADLSPAKTVAPAAAVRPNTTGGLALHALDLRAVRKPRSVAIRSTCSAMLQGIQSFGTANTCLAVESNQ